MEIIKMAINLEEAREIRDELLQEGFEIAEAKEYMEREYELVEAEYRGDTTKIGYFAAALGGLVGLPTFLLYMWYKKGARRRFINEVSENFGEKASDELASAMTKYNLNKNDKSQLVIIRKYHAKLQAIYKSKK